jgi:hypothetical protein
MRSFGPTADRGPFCSAIGPKRGCHDVEFRWRHRGFRDCDAHVLALVLVMMAIAETRADVRMVRYKRSRPTKFLGPPDDQSFTDFKCYWVDPTAQYFCQETQTNEKKESPPIGFALEAQDPGRVGLFPGDSIGRHQCELFHQAAALLVQKEAAPILLPTVAPPVRRWQDFRLHAR